MGSRVKITGRTGGEQIIEPSELHPPSGDPGLLAILPTALLFLDDGTLLVGVGDGTIMALDSTGHRRFSLGLRGAIRGFAPMGDGLVAVSTDKGVVALVTSEGRLRWEQQITAELLSPPVIGPGGMILVASPRGVFSLSPKGELVFSHAASLGNACCIEDDAKALTLSLDASGVVTLKELHFRLDDPHPAIPSLAPTFPLTYHRALAGEVVSLMAMGPKVLFALVESSEDRFELVRIEGGKITKRIRVPSRASRGEVFSDENGKEATSRAWLWIDGLVTGPKGDPMVLARRVGTPRKNWNWRGGMPLFSKGHLLELRGGALTDRNDLFDAFTDHPSTRHTTIVAAPYGPGRLFCFGDEDAAACAAYDGAGFHVLTPPAPVASIGRVGDSTWIVTEAGTIFRSEGDDFLPVSTPEGASFDTIAGTSDHDVWASGRGYTVSHHDGARWTEVGVPTPLRDVYARTADDAWSNDGRVHWDGSRWSLVSGVPPARTVIARGRDDVWLGGAKGLWHGTAPGISVVQLPAPTSPDEGAIAAPSPLPLGAPEAGYAVEKTRIEVAGGEPLTTAKRMSVSRDGTLWVEGWNRLVEVDPAGKATILRREERISHDRWFYPEAQGRGIILKREGQRLNMRDSVERLEGGKSIREAVQLDRHDAVAVDGDGRGTVWVAGTFASDSPWSARDMREHELSAHALVRAKDGGGFRPVLGLPSATFCDVAVAPDGGAFFAGALNPGPMGEGILFHARGNLGSGGTTRYRAPASLLAVAAFGPDEAWAVGADGALVHVASSAVTRYALGSHAWLRAVAGSGPKDVWMGGDDGTLLHYDGREFHAVSHPLGARAAITSIALAHGAVWAVGPSGILRITKRP